MKVGLWVSLKFELTIAKTKKLEMAPSKRFLKVLHSCYWHWNFATTRNEVSGMYLVRLLTFHFCQVYLYSFCFSFHLISTFLSIWVILCAFLPFLYASLFHRRNLFTSASFASFLTHILLSLKQSCSLTSCRVGIFLSKSSIRPLTHKFQIELKIWSRIKVPNIQAVWGDASRTNILMDEALK